MRLYVVMCPACACWLLFVQGCGGGGDQRDTAPVRGIVKCEGAPLTSGTITFTPINDAAKGNPGKPASGVVQADGTFVLTTYEPEDGAIIGRHEVTYTPPEAGEGEEEEEEDSDSASIAEPVPLDDSHPCRFGGRSEAEVVDGDNSLTIDLGGLSPEGDEDGEEPMEE